MRRGLILSALLLAGISTAAAAPNQHDVRRLNEAAQVISELRSVPDKSIPENIWDRAQCVLVVPDVKKAAFVVGGEYGRGVMSCRTKAGWSSPVFMTLEKGSFGAQIGAESSDMVLLVMNERGIERLLQDKVTLGADLSLAAGPVGRTGTAATDAQLGAEILSYSRARGLFAGIDLAGGVLRPDAAATDDLYGRSVSSRDILLGEQKVPTPAAAHGVMHALSGASHKPVTKHSH